VDVDRVLAAPRRVGLGVPDPLQVRGLAARARGADQQVAAVLQVQRRERRVVDGLGAPDPLVGRQVRRLPQVEVETAEQRLVLAGGVRGDLVVAAPRGRGELCRRRGRRVTGEVLEGHVAGRDRDQQRQRDRKSTRLNSSHVKISYAVFCL